MEFRTRPHTDEQVEETIVCNEAKDTEELSQGATSWDQRIKHSHSVGVTATAKGVYKGVTGTLKANYNYDYEKDTTSSARTFMENKAKEAFDIGISHSKTYTNLAAKDGESGFFNLWYFKVAAITKDHEEVKTKTGCLFQYAIRTSGLCYNVSPNCLPGHCKHDDPNCWECEGDDYKIDPDFELPDRCRQDKEEEETEETALGKENKKLQQANRALRKALEELAA